MPKQTIDDQVLLFGGAYRTRAVYTILAAHHPPGAMSLPEWEDPWTKITRLRRAKCRSTHACCWAAGEESEALWRLYCKDPDRRGLGVAVQTTLEKLERSVDPHNLYVSPVTYRHYYEGPAFDDELDPFMHKRKGFHCENEVRLLKVNGAHYAALINGAPAVAELDEYLPLSWPAADVIEHIVLSPYAEGPFEERARAVIEAADPSLRNRVILSVLNPRRYAPGF